MNTSKIDHYRTSVKANFCPTLKAISCALLLLTGCGQPGTKTAEIKTIPMDQRVDPDLLVGYAPNKPIDLSLEQLKIVKADFKNIPGTSDPEVNIYNVKIATTDQTDSIRLRIYEPVNRQGKLAGIYWLHGGGYLFGVPEQDDAQNIRFVKEVGAIVIAPDYRTAPEHPYPIPFDDAFAGLEWMSKMSDDLGIDKERIAVCGASAGGGLCAAVVLKARDIGAPKIAFQMPLYPMIDDRCTSPSHFEDFTDKVWNNKANIQAWDYYLGHIAPAQRTSYMAAARETNLVGLPPAYSCVGELDPFRDDTADYMFRLSQAGVPAEFHLYPGAYHAFEVNAPLSAYAKRAVDEYVYVLKKALNKTS